MAMGPVLYRAPRPRRHRRWRTATLVPALLVAAAATVGLQAWTAPRRPVPARPAASSRPARLNRTGRRVPAATGPAALACPPAAPLLRRAGEPVGAGRRRRRPRSATHQQCGTGCRPPLRRPRPLRSPSTTALTRASPRGFWRSWPVRGRRRPSSWSAARPPPIRGWSAGSPKQGRWSVGTPGTTSGWTGCPKRGLPLRSTAPTSYWHAWPASRCGWCAHPMGPTTAGWWTWRPPAAIGLSHSQPMQLRWLNGRAGSYGGPVPLRPPRRVSRIAAGLVGSGP
jgi:hypothetical protein